MTADVLVTFEPDDADAERRAAALASRLALPCAGSVTAGHAVTSRADALLLVVTGHGLELREASAPTTKGVQADIAAIAGRPRPTRRHPLIRAIGRACHTVIDATAGLGSDAVRIALVGYQVTAVERHPVVAALLEDGRARAADDPVFQERVGERLRVVVGDAAAFLAAAGGDRPDAVYVDPMYPPKRKASALPPKPVRLLRRLAGPDDDGEDLLAVARRVARRRVVVKRPTHGPPLGGMRPTMSFESKLVRYDVYVGEGTEGRRD